MKFHYLVILTLLSYNVIGQKILLQDELNKDNGNWYVGTTKSYSSSIKNGKLYVENFVGNGYASEYVRTLPLDFHKDFIIEMELSELSNKDGNGYGIRFGYNLDDKNHYSFIINTTGYYYIFNYQKEKFINLKPWTKDPTIINKKGMSNTLKIENKGKHYSFYVNATKVYDCPAFNFYGNYLGVEINDRMKVTMDKITVYQDTPPIHLSKDLPKGIVKTRMNNTINSPYQDIYPRISPDGQTLFMTRRDHPENMGSDKFMSDVWFSELDAKTKEWSKAKNLGAPINTSGENYVISITPDNNTLLVGNTYNKDGSVEAQGLSLSHKTTKGWSLPETVVVKDFYNKNKYIDACLSVNRKVIIYSIEMDDSYGEKDLYVCFLTNDNTWTHPKHMGATINTFTDDIGPFLASDGKTLYYSRRLTKM